MMTELTAKTVAALLLSSLLALGACNSDDPGAGGGSQNVAGGSGSAGSSGGNSGGAAGSGGGAAGNQANSLLAADLTMVPQYLVAHGDNLYFTGDGGLYQIPKAGGTAQALWTTQAAGALAVVGDSILVVTAGYDSPSSVFEGQKIGKIALTGGALTVVATVQFPKDPKTAEGSLVSGLVVDGDKVFLQDSGSATCEKVAGAVGVMDADGSNPTQLIADQGCVSSLSVDGDQLYWIDYRASAGGSIRRMPKAGGTVETLLTDPAISQRMVVASDAIYYISGAGIGTLNRVAKAGGTPTAVGTQVTVNPLVSAGSDVYAFDNEIIRFAGGMGPGVRLGQYPPGYSFLIGVATNDEAAVYAGGAVISGAHSTGAIARHAR